MSGGTVLGVGEGDIAIGSRALNEEYAKRLYDICQDLECEFGLRNGATCLFWHLDGIIGNHLVEVKEI